MTWEGPSADRRVATRLFIAALVSSAWFFQGGGWNQNAFLDLTRAVVERHSIAITPYVGNTGDWSKVGERYFINKNPGAAFLSAPAHAALRLFLPNAYDGFATAQAATHATIALSHSLLFAAATVAMFAWLKRFVSRSAALAATTAGIFGTTMLPYSSMMNAGVMAACAYVIAAWALWASTEEEGRRGAVLALGAGAALGAGVLAEPTVLVGIPAFALVAAARGRRGRLWAWGALGALPFAVVLGAYNHAMTGSVFTSGYQYQNPIFNDPGAVLNVFRAPSATVLYHITLDPYRGLLWVSPVMALCIPGLVLALRDRRTRELAALCFWIVAVHILFNVCFSAWHGGWTIGPRYLIPAMPFFAAMLAPIFDHRHFRRPALLFLAVSALIELAIAAVNPMPPQMKGVDNPLAQFILPALGRGLVSVNTQTIFQLAPDGLGLHNLEDRWAAYNVGELLGLPGLWSVAPILVLWGVAWWSASRVLSPNWRETP